MIEVRNTAVSGKRRFFVLLVFSTAALLLLWRAIELQHYEQDKLQEQADKRQLRDVAIPAHRGIITDRNGDPLAISTPVYAAWVDPQKFGLDTAAGDDASERLAQVLGLDAAALRARIERRKGTRFVYIKRHLKPGLRDKVRELGLPGVGLSREYRRFYPMAEAAAQLIGNTNIDDVGIEGIEKEFDQVFRGVPGKKRVLTDLHKRTVKHVELIAAPKPGKHLALTIDRNIQYRAYRALKTAVKKNRARSGSVVVMDAQSGEVLAAVNQPSFNPNTREFVPEHRRNRVLTDAFEPGSTIKPFIVAALLDSGLASLATSVDTAPGYYRVSGRAIADFDNYGTLTLPGVIMKSSNVGISKVALKMSAKQLWQMFRDLGFGQIPGTGFPGETGGKLAHYVDWRDIDQAVVSYGYGMSVSLLQLVHAYSTFANDGWRPPLSLVKGTQASRKTQVFKPETAHAMREILKRVVSRRGTGGLAKVEGFTTAGKTGTTHKNKGGSYIEAEYLSLFVGFAPANRPRLVAAVMIDTPTGGEYFGGAVAAPVFSEVMQAALRRLGIPDDAFSPDSHEFVGYTLANE